MAKLLTYFGTMNNDIIINDTLSIPSQELEITASRSGGAGGQHVNKTDTKITVRWNVKNSNALNDEQKARIMQNLHKQLTTEGDLLVHNSTSRSQEHNKKMALKSMAEKIRKALIVPKKRMATRVPQAAKAARVDTKMHRGVIKKLRNKNSFEE
jgi:ribosome-associated protein